jgi:D-glycero-alpha-D-manno-heptose-7-phosphate kinase
MIVRARAPLRLGLAGGGTDVSPYCDQFGGCVLNATISQYAYAMIKPNDLAAVRFTASDQAITEDLELSSSYELSGPLILHRAVYNEIISLYNNGKSLPVDIVTYCDAPPGSGLGSSSTLVVAMVKAFAEFLNLPLDDYGIAKLAFKIERLDCGLNGGRQDQYSATFGGFNFMEFYEDYRAIVNPLRIKSWVISELEASFLLFYTGVSRESAKIINDQSQNMNSGKIEVIESFHRMKAEALMMKEAILKGDFNGIVESMKLGWESKKKSASSVSNNYLDQIYDAAMIAGARAGKVSGAGGGGFMMFFVQPERRMSVINELKRFDGKASNVHFTKGGAQAWKIL